MAWRQKKSPNLNVPAKAGWCLKYVDDAGSATKRQPYATAAFNVEKKAGRIRTDTPPQNVWVVGFLSFGSGNLKGLGHVFFMKYLGNGKYDIRDSESRSGHRPSAYSSVQQVLQWCGRYSPRYDGWSTHCDGVQYAETYTPPAAPTRKAKSGKAKVIVGTLNVRTSPSTSAKIAAVYKKGETFNYDSYITANGYTWLSYVSFGGVRRYVAQAKGKERYVSGGV